MTAQRNTYSSIVTAYRAVVMEVMDHGHTVKPRGQKTKELLSFNFRVTDPHGAISRKGYSQPMAAVEAIQLIGGFSDTRLVLQVNPTMAEFMSDEGGREIYQHGNYGERVGPFLADAINKLKIDQDSRQAVIHIFDAGRDYVSEPDIPCTLSIQFMIRDFALNLHVTMRSNDVWWGLPYDMFQFTQLQLSVANVLNIPIGDYYHTANSMHAYERNFDDIDTMLRQQHEINEAYVPRGLNASSITELQILARQLTKPEVIDDFPTGAFTPSEAWYAKQLSYVSPRA